jgi:hypothetical protein
MKKKNKKILVLTWAACRKRVKKKLKNLDINPGQPSEKGQKKKTLILTWATRLKRRKKIYI